MTSDLSSCFIFTQEKYKRDQEKLQEEWLKAQEEIEKVTSERVLQGGNKFWLTGLKYLNVSKRALKVLLMKIAIILRQLHKQPVVFLAFNMTGSHGSE